MMRNNTDESQFPKWLFLFFSVCICWLGLFWLISTKSENDTALLFGLSLLRIAISVAVILISFVFISLFFPQSQSLPKLSAIQQHLFDKNPKAGIIILRLSICYLALGFLLYPSTQLAVFSSAFERIKPVVFIVFGLSASYLVWGLINRYHFSMNTMGKYIREKKPQYISTGLVIGTLIILWIVIYFTKLGIQPDLFWKVAGVPLLSFQLYLITGYLLFFIITSKYILRPILQNPKINPIVVDIIVFFIIWLIASAIWISTPQGRSVFAPGPYPPTTVLYPHSDAAVHDSGGEMITIGLPLNFGGFTDKPAYMFFLGLLHLLFGDDQNHIVIAQTILLALFPAVLYLLGKELYDRNLGIFIGLMNIARAGNAITAVTQITTTSVKELMSEMPLALALALLCLFILKYIKHKNRDVYPICIGGVFGISILIRPHPLLFTPFLVVIFILVQRKNIRTLFKQLMFFLLPVLLVIVPISISNIQNGRTPDSLEKIFSVLSQRADISTPITDSDLTDNTAPLPTIGTQPGTSTPEFQTPQPSAVVPGNGSAPKTQPIHAISNKAARLFSHFLHNELTIVLSLPTSFIFNNLDKSINVPFWNETPAWDGRLSFAQGIAIFLNLVIISFGIAKYLVTRQLAGLIPLLLQFTINFSNSVARSSGGRFLVPVDWIIYIYYGVGLFEIFILLLSSLKEMINSIQYENVLQIPSRQAPNTEEMNRKIVWPAQAVLLSFFLIFGLALAYSHLVIPNKYPARYDPIRILKERNAYNVVSGTIGGFEDVVKHLNVTTIYGKALYPRYYRANQGEPSRNSELKVMPYSRLTYEVIGPEGIIFVTLPTTAKGKKLIHGDTVLVYGCKTDDHTLDAIYLVIFGEKENTFYLRSENPPYQCSQ
jgi:hypothetical protein